MSNPRLSLLQASLYTSMAQDIFMNPERYQSLKPALTRMFVPAYYFSPEFSGESVMERLLFGVGPAARHHAVAAIEFERSKNDPLYFFDNYFPKSERFQSRGYGRSALSLLAQTILPEPAKPSTFLLTLGFLSCTFSASKPLVTTLSTSQTCSKTSLITCARVTPPLPAFSATTWSLPTGNGKRSWAKPRSRFPSTG